MIETAEIIQIIIAIIMLLSTGISYFNVLKNNKTQKSILTNEIVKFEKEKSFNLFKEFEKEKQFLIYGREIEVIDELFAQEYLNLYNYIAALKNQKKIDEDLFYSSFLDSFEKVYGILLLYKTHKYRIEKYEDLCIFFNEIGLSVKEFNLENF